MKPVELQLLELEGRLERAELALESAMRRLDLNLASQRRVQAYMSIIAGAVAIWVAGLRG